MFADVISTGLQAVLTEVFESVDKDQLNVSLVGDIFKESHLELTDLRLKKTLFKDMNLHVDVKEGLVGKLVIQGLSGVMTGNPVTVTVSEVLLLLAPAEGLSDPEACLAARRLGATLKEMFANRYAEDFIEDALGVKREDKLSVQGQNKLNRKLLRHIMRKLLSGVSIILQTVHVRFEMPAGGTAAGARTSVKASSGVGGGGACDAVGIMLPNVMLRTCVAEHPSFAKFVGFTPLDRVASKTAAVSKRGGGDAGQEDKKNFSVVRKRATFSNLQVYGDYGVDSYVTAISNAVSVARNKASKSRTGSSSSNSNSNPAGAVAAARAVRLVFQQKWKSERHALLFKPLAVEVGAEVHQWDVPGGKSIVPVYRLRRVNVGIGELQAVLDSEQGRLLGTAIGGLVNLMRRAKFNRFVPQAYLPLRNLPPPKVRPPKPARDGAPGGIFPSVETWSWSAEMERTVTGGIKGRPRTMSEAVLRGGFRKEGGAWARAMWRFAGACVRHDVRLALTRKLPASLPMWDGTVAGAGASNGGGVIPFGEPEDEEDGHDPTSSSSSPLTSPNSWRVKYMRLHARTLMPREAKNVAPRVPDVRRMGVPRGREPLSLDEMWEMARVESFAPSDEVVFLRSAARISSHFEWGRVRRARLSAKSTAEKKGVPSEAAAAAGAAAAAATTWTAKDDSVVLARLDELRSRRFVAALVEKAKAKSGAAVGVGAASEGDDDDDDDEEIAKMHFAATAAQGFSDDEDDDDDEDSEDDDEDEDDEEFVNEGGGVSASAAVTGDGPDITSNGRRGKASFGGGGGPGSKFSLADIAAKAKETTTVPQSPQAAVAAAVAARSGGGFGGKKGVGGKVGVMWAKLLGLPRVVFQIESAGIELRTRISGGSRRPLVALSAGGISGSMEGDETRRLLWWELRMGQVTFRDLCSSWGGVGKGGGGTGSSPTSKTLLSGSASGVEGREWAHGWDTSGASSRAFLVLRVVHDPSRVCCGLFEGSAASLAQLRTHVLLGCVAGKIPPQVLAVFNAAARDVLLNSSGSNRRNTSSALNADDSVRQLRVALTSLFTAFSGSKSVGFRLKKRKGPRAAIRALSLARGAVAGGKGGEKNSPSPRGNTPSSSASAGEIDSRELYKAMAGMLPGDFEVRVHTSEVVVQVDSRAQDLLDAGKVALEAIGEDGAAANMKGGPAAADSIKLEVNVAPFKMDACRISYPSPELWIDTGFVRTRLRAPDKAVEAVVTALLTSAQRTKAAMALLSGEAELSEGNA